MQRRDFLKTAALGAAAAAVPGPALTLPRPAPALHGPVPASTPATGTALLTDARYLDHVLIRSNGTRPPEVPERLVRMRAELEARGLIEATVPLSPTADPLDRIRAHHTGEHVDSVRQLGVTSRVAELAVSGALTAVDAVADGTVRNAFCAIRPPGHHANNTGAEEGFCFYSNAAIAARYAQDVHGYERVV
ncbi:MAG: twin-arginine translocation signal domain-containing protein, partial [Gemmatimonadota bacterium]|nr:twin-arginine translocation signal domain-containing protein [Gemmatimonadota bacterium]